ncbi:hypothetical protein, partial [Pengzhenrongella sp.]|uniref:hypothetical protein n=1 Tax=Pengzhenrongella sp. TaxID=2888820 RepID=UPI002F92065A
VRTDCPRALLSPLAVLCQVADRPRRGPRLHSSHCSPRRARARTGPPDPLATRAASRLVMHFGLLLLASLLTSALPLPWQAASLGFMVAALVVGIRALSAAWRAGVRGVLVPMLAVGLALTALMAMVMASLLALWPIQLARQDCLQGALTISATEKCQVDFKNSVNHVMNDLKKPPSTS